MEEAMSRISIKETDPARYAQVKAEQEQLRKQFSGLTVARLCPYCSHKIEVLYRGTHGACSIKCPHCGEDVTLPPVAFRMAR